jgi:hypothetical protein
MNKIKILTLNASGKSAFAQVLVKDLAIGPVGNIKIDTSKTEVGAEIEIGDIMLHVEHSDFNGKEIPWLVAG